MYASRFRNCVCTERHRIGGARKKRGSQWLRATLRREVHAAQEALEAQTGGRGLHQAFHRGPGLGDLRQLSSGILEVAQEFLVGVDGFGFLAGLFQDFPQIELRQGIRQETWTNDDGPAKPPVSICLQRKAQVLLGLRQLSQLQISTANLQGNVGTELAAKLLPARRHFL